MFDNLTSINFSLVSVRQTRRRYAAESHGVCCRVQEKPNSGLIQADSGYSCLCWSVHLWNLATRADGSKCT